jgi:hypothetical protein
MARQQDDHHGRKHGLAPTREAQSSSRLELKRLFKGTRSSDAFLGMDEVLQTANWESLIPHSPDEAAILSALVALLS